MSKVEGRMGAQRVGLVLGSLFLLPFDLRPPTVDISYSASHLACAAFLEDVRTEVDARQGLVPVRERGHRSGILVFRARAAGAALRFEAWYDSLAVWHESAAGRLVPDTDGLIGGRWRGTLTPAGDVALDVRPFLPPDLRAVADLSDVPLDFLPPLPREPVAPGAEWAGPDGLRIGRLADSAGIGRYRWRLERGSEVPGLGPDSTVRLRQSIMDQGRFLWSDRLGVIGWDREVAIGTRVPSGPRVRAAVQGEVTQRVTVRRLTDADGCA